MFERKNLSQIDEAKRRHMVFLLLEVLDVTESETEHHVPI